MHLYFGAHGPKAAKSFFIPYFSPHGAHGPQDNIIPSIVNFKEQPQTLFQTNTK